jgi:hypothetical protein
MVYFISSTFLKDFHDEQFDLQSDFLNASCKLAKLGRHESATHMALLQTAPVKISKKTSFYNLHNPLYF